MGLSQQRRKAESSEEPQAERDSSFRSDATQVHAIMTPQPLSIGSDCSLSDAIALLVQNSLTGLPVTECNSKKVVGFLSGKDCLPRLREVSDACGKDRSHLRVSDVMSRSIQSLTREQLVDDVYELFLDEWYHMYPVVSADGTLLGTISRQQILDYFNQKNSPASESSGFLSSRRY